MPFMPAVSLNQCSGALLELGVSAAVFLGSVGVPLWSFVLWPVRQFNLLASTTSAVRTRASLVLGLSFYPLEQAPNPVVYAMSKLRDSNERFNLNRGVLNPKPGAKRAPLLPKNSSADWRLKNRLGGG
jgi:hypothetical protein